MHLNTSDHGRVSFKFAFLGMGTQRALVLIGILRLKQKSEHVLIGHFHTPIMDVFSTCLRAVWNPAFTCQAFLQVFQTFLDRFWRGGEWRRVQHDSKLFELDLGSVEWGLVCARIYCWGAQGLCEREWDLKQGESKELCWTICTLCWGCWVRLRRCTHVCWGAQVSSDFKIGFETRSIE